MARRMARPRRREGRGIGERIAEIAVYIVILGAAAYAVNWYFNVHLKSPGVALQAYLGTLKSGDPDKQYEMLSAGSRARMSQREYARSHPLAHGLSQRIESANVTAITEQGDRAEADVTVRIRRTGQELYQASVDSYRDHWVLVREAGGWKIALDDSKTNLEVLKAVKSR